MTTTLGVLLACCAAAAVLQLVYGPFAADGLRLYNSDAGRGNNRLNHHHHQVLHHQQQQQHLNGSSSSANYKGSGLLPRALKRADPAAVKECQFALKLYRHLGGGAEVGGGQEDNVLFSPLSVLTVISALTEGANGTTAKELLAAVNRTAAEGPLHRGRVADVTAAAATKKGQRHAYALTIANRLFVQEDFRLLPQFLRSLQRSYGMDAVRVDFAADPRAAEESVNAWVSSATNGMIDALVPPGLLDAQTRLLVANAVYFKGDWETAFPAANTRLRPFYYQKEKYVQVSMMSVESEFPYADFAKLGFEMVELAYAGREVSMFVVLPHEGQTLAAVARRLLQRPQLVARLSRRARPTAITVVLPVFALERSLDLKGPLAAMGVKRAFEQGRADLSGMTGTRELYVSDALHRAAIEVSERGTRAAAATAVVIKGRSMNSDPVFRADRPFMFLVRHNPTESVLFMGEVRRLKDEAPVDVAAAASEVA